MSNIATTQDTFSKLLAHQGKTREYTVNTELLAVDGVYKEVFDKRVKGQQEDTSMYLYGIISNLKVVTRTAVRDGKKNNFDVIQYTVKVLYNGEVTQLGGSYSMETFKAYGKQLGFKTAEDFYNKPCIAKIDMATHDNEGTEFDEPKPFVKWATICDQDGKAIEYLSQGSEQLKAIVF